MTGTIDIKRKTSCLALGLATFFAAMDLSVAATNETPRLISADLQQTNGPLDTMFKFCVGAGRANEGLRADWQRQLTYAHRECGFQYIRMHGLFCDDMGVYREDSHGNPEYNWQYIDELYDFLHSIGMKPFVELGFMPDGLASGSKTIFWWRGNVTPPKDMTKWADFIRAFVLHEQERYGDAEVRTWYFEVWNEPNLDGFWAGTQQQYFDLYAATARAIKSVSADYKVGGPATAGCGWVPEFIHFCDTNHAPVDFISTHTYGVESGYLDEHGNAGTVLSQNPNSIIGDVKRVRQADRRFGDAQAGTALHRMELLLHAGRSGSRQLPQRGLHFGQAQKMRRRRAIHVLLDVHGHFRGSRPALGGLSRRLRPDQLRGHQQAGVLRVSIFEPARPDGIEGQRSVLVDLRRQFRRRAGVGLGFHQHASRPEQCINQVFYKRDLPSQPKNKVTLNLSHLPKGKYTVETYKVGYRVNDAYATYRDLGSPAQLTKAQVAEIKSKNSGAPLEVRTVKIGRDGKFEQQFDLRENDVVLVTLKPQK